MLIETLVISVLLAFYLYRGEKNFNSISVKGIYLVFISSLIELVCIYILKNNFYGLSETVIRYTLHIEVLVYIFLLIFIYLNINIKGMKIILFGTILNFIAVTSNLGYMPVDGQILLDRGFLNSYNELKEGLVFAHNIINSNTNYVYLVDIINIPPPYPFPKSISLGDVILDIGVFILVLDIFKESIIRFKKVDF